MMPRMDDGFSSRKCKKCLHDVLNTWVFTIWLNVTNDDQGTAALRQSNILTFKIVKETDGRRR